MFLQGHRARLGFCIFLLFVSTKSEESDSPIVRSKLGEIIGKRETTDSGKSYNAFYSIPYAKPPINDLRFRPPEPLPAFDSPFDATAEGPPCLQIPPVTEKGLMGSENCLWMSVFVPEGATEASSLPVLFWIHGGRALVGSARTQAYSPTYIMDEGDIILVSIQYRLGALGYLTTEDSAAPGNYGLKDQQLALKWVHEHIGAFGGDPDRVTLVGHSFGASSAHGHLFAPGSKGLFRGVMSLSGTANMGWASRAETSPGIEVAKHQADLLGCPTNVSSQEMVDCLRKVSAEDLTRSQSNLHSFLLHSPAKIPLTTYMSRIDKEAEEPFWPKDPLESLRDGDYDHSVPWVNGVTSMEGAWYGVALLGDGLFGQWTPEQKLPELNANRKEAFWHLCLRHHLTEEHHGAILKHYFGDRTELTNSPADKVTFSELIGDVLFNYESFLAAHLHSKIEGAAPVYQYRFDYRGNWSYTHLFDNREADYGGVAHLDDIRFFLPMGFSGQKNEEEQDVARRHVQRIAHFTRENRFDASVWPAYKHGEGKYLVVGEDAGRAAISNKAPFARERFELWRKIWNDEENVLNDFDVKTHKQEL